jgi:hypothetical protein
MAIAAWGDTELDRRRLRVCAAGRLFWEEDHGINRSICFSRPDGVIGEPRCLFGEAAKTVETAMRRCAAQGI